LENSDQPTDQMDIDPSSQPIPIDETSTAVPRRTTRVSHPPVRYGFLHEEEQELSTHEEVDHGDDPLTYEEAISDIDSSKWIDAMKSEIDSMYKNQVWDLVDPPEGIVPTEKKWVFKKKISSDGKVETYKARLLAKGFRQR